MAIFNGSVSLSMSTITGAFMLKKIRAKEWAKRPEEDGERTISNRNSLTCVQLSVCFALLGDVNLKTKETLRRHRRYIEPISSRCAKWRTLGELMRNTEVEDGSAKVTGTEYTAVCILDS